MLTQSDVITNVYLEHCKSECCIVSVESDQHPDSPDHLDTLSVWSEFPLHSSGNSGTKSSTIHSDKDLAMSDDTLSP